MGKKHSKVEKSTDPAAIDITLTTNNSSDKYSRPFGISQSYSVLVQKLNNNSYSKCKSKSPSTTRFHKTDSKDYVVLQKPQELADRLPPPCTLILDFTMTHTRYGIGHAIDSGIVLSIKIDKLRVFINKTLSILSSYQ